MHTHMRGPPATAQGPGLGRNDHDSYVLYTHIYIYNIQNNVTSVELAPDEDMQNV